MWGFQVLMILHGGLPVVEAAALMIVPLQVLLAVVVVPRHLLVLDLMLVVDPVLE